MQVHTRGEFGGLGIEVTMEKGIVKVVAPIDETPAARAGIRRDDLVVIVAGNPVASCAEVRAALARQESGNTVRISILRDGKLHDFKLEP